MKSSFCEIVAITVDRMEDAVVAKELIFGETDEEVSAVVVEVVMSAVAAVVIVATVVEIGEGVEEFKEVWTGF